MKRWYHYRHVRCPELLVIAYSVTQCSILGHVAIGGSESVSDSWISFASLLKRTRRLHPVPRASRSSRRGVMVGDGSGTGRSTHLELPFVPNSPRSSTRSESPPSRATTSTSAPHPSDIYRVLPLETRRSDVTMARYFRRTVFMLAHDITYHTRGRTWWE